MKPSITPIDREIRLGDDEFIVSKTDTKGIITYCNRVFMHIAGYSEAELLGKQHNIVRHPDMPRGVFRFLWQTLQDGEEFFGYVKNMCKSGAYYWVFANVTPDYDARGRVVGYYSVRRKPSDQAIAALAPIYKEMLERGNPGLHHYCFAVEDYAAAYAEALASGFVPVVQAGNDSSGMLYCESTRIPGLVLEIIAWDQLSKPYFEGTRSYLAGVDQNQLIHTIQL